MNNNQIVTVKINGDALHKAVIDSPFTLAQVCAYINKNNTTISDAKRRNRINPKDLDGICKLLGKKPEKFLVVETPGAKKPPEQKKRPRLEAEKPKVELRHEEHPMTAREDKTQNWAINIFRELADQTDRMDLQLSQISDNTAAVRGLREAIMEQVDLLRQIKVLLQ